MTTPVDPSDQYPSFIAPSEVAFDDSEVPNFYVDEYPWSGGTWGEGEFNPDAYNPKGEYGIAKGKTIRLETNPDKDIEDPYDLENVRFINHEKVKRLLFRLEGIAGELEEEPDKYVTAMIGTGGTIAMKLIDGVAKPALDPETILGELPNSKRERFRAAAVELAHPIDSSKMELDYIADTVISMTWLWAQMTPLLREKFAGFVVTHGTDTMSESGSEMDMMLGPNCPFSVAMVGSQKKIDDEINDVSANIVGTFDTLYRAKREGGIARFAFMNGTSGAAMSLTGIVKRSDSIIRAFETPIHKEYLTFEDFGAAQDINKTIGKVALPGIKPVQKPVNTLLPSGVVDKRLALFAHPQETPDFLPIIMRGHVPVKEIVAKKGTDPEELYNEILSNPNRLGLALTTFGSFNDHPARLRAVAAAAKKLGIPYFAANPFPMGSTQHTYETSKLVRELGFVPVQMMPNALRVKVLLAHYIFGENVEKIVNFVANTNYVGEQPTGWGEQSEV